MIKVSVIIVNYNTGDLVMQCIESVLKQREVTFEIIVVDNASHDSSVTLLKEKERLGQIKLQLNENNVGFGRANNQAAQIAQGEYLFLLNPDAVCQGNVVLRDMLRFIEMHPSMGLAGTQVIRTRKGGYSIPQTTYPGQRHTTLTFNELPGKIAWVIGASMFVRADVFSKVKGFDEAYFLYGEEADLCLRIRKSGYEIGYNPVVAVAHIGGASESVSSVKEVWKRKQNGLQLFIKKHYPLIEAKKVMQVYKSRASRRLVVLKIKQWLGLFGEKHQAKKDRYQVVVEQANKFLCEME